MPTLPTAPARAIPHHREAQQPRRGSGLPGSQELLAICCHLLKVWCAIINLKGIKREMNIINTPNELDL